MNIKLSYYSGFIVLMYYICQGHKMKELAKLRGMIN